MRILLLRGIGLLHPFPRERSFSSARAIVRVSSDICYGAKLQGDCGYASSDRPNLRVSEISWLGRLESVTALDQLLYRAVVNRRIAHRFLYLRKTARHRHADEFRSLSTQIFMGYFQESSFPGFWNRRDAFSGVRSRSLYTARESAPPSALAQCRGQDLPCYPYVPFSGSSSITWQ